MLHTNLAVNEQGHLTLAGADTVALAKKYGTPLMLVDEQRIRDNCRTYVQAMKEHFGGDSMPLFASKAFCFKALYQIVAEEGMGTDIVSPGELYTAKAAGFPLERPIFTATIRPTRTSASALKRGSAALSPTTGKN